MNRKKIHIDSTLAARIIAGSAAIMFLIGIGIIISAGSKDGGFSLSRVPAGLFIWTGFMFIMGLFSAIFAKNKTLHFADSLEDRSMPTLKAAAMFLFGALFFCVPVTVIIGIIPYTGSQTMKWPFLGFFMILGAMAMIHAVTEYSKSRRSMKR